MKNRNVQIPHIKKLWKNRSQTLRFLNIPAATFKLRWTSLASGSVMLLNRRTWQWQIYMIWWQKRAHFLSIGFMRIKECNIIHQIITYFSFPASLEANLVYQSATLKAIETSSKTASCWALEGREDRYSVSTFLGTLLQRQCNRSASSSTFFFFLTA